MRSELEYIIDFAACMVQHVYGSPRASNQTLMRYFSPINSNISTRFFNHFLLTFSRLIPIPKSNSIPGLMLISCQVMKTQALAVVSWILTGFQSFFFLPLLKKFAVALLTCIFALGGVIVGIISGALKGQTTETGLLRGIGVGAVTGAITAVQLIELIINGEPFSKAALICSLVNGKIFMEWVSPAVLKAYQWQISTMETGLGDISDIFEVNVIRGLSQDTINGLPVFEFDTATTPCSDTSCAICLQELRDGESTRLLPSCRHFFHMHCIDEWLSRQGTCPVCRKDV